MAILPSFQKGAFKVNISTAFTGLVFILSLTDTNVCKHTLYNSGIHNTHLCFFNSCTDVNTKRELLKLPRDLVAYSLCDENMPPEKASVPSPCCPQAHRALQVY